MPDSSSKRPWFLVVVAMFAVGALVFWSAGRVAPGGATPPPVATANATASGTAAVPPASPVTPAAGVAESDPRPALAQALLLADPRQRAREFGELMQSWVARDPEAALAYLRQLPHQAEYTQALLMVIPAIAVREPERALQLAAELATTREDRVIYNILFHRFARENPVAATQRLGLVADRQARDNSLRAITDAWAVADSAATVAWGRSLPNAYERGIVLESAFLEVAQREPLAFLTAVPSDLDGSVRERVVATAVRKLNETDPARAATFLGLLITGSEGYTLTLIDIACVWAGRDATAALAWIERLPAGRSRDLGLNNFFQTWAQQAPEAAARRAAQLPAGATLDRVAPLVAGTLAQGDALKAIVWTDTLASESARAVSLVAVATAWSRREPAAALVWAAGLPVAATRDAAVIDAYGVWQLQNPAAARAWLESASLAPELKSRLRK